MLHAIHSAPARMASAASDSCAHPVSGLCPWMTATGRSSALRVVAMPTSRTSCTRPSVPTTRAREPGSTCSASSRPRSAHWSPRARRRPGTRGPPVCAATSAGRRLALLVTKYTGTDSASTVSTAWSTGSLPAKSVPSRSANTASYPVTSADSDTVGPSSVVSASAVCGAAVCVRFPPRNTTRSDEAGSDVTAQTWPARTWPARRRSPAPAGVGARKSPSTSGAATPSDVAVGAGFPSPTGATSSSSSP